MSKGKGDFGVCEANGVSDVSWIMGGCGECE